MTYECSFRQPPLSRQRRLNPSSIGLPKVRATYFIHPASFVTIIPAARAYKHALATMGTLTAHPPAHTREPTPGYSNTLLHSYLQSPGPIASALRIVLKLKHQTWLPKFFTSRGGKEEGARGRREEEMRGKAVKVVDLLQHAAELGNTDALYTLGQLALVSQILVVVTISN